jgi:cytidyltransferase-like protein
LAHGKRVVIAHGTFDLLHSGHIGYLEHARFQGDILLVALSSDRMAQVRKGAERPIRSFVDRKATIDALRCVDGSFEAPYETDDIETNLLGMLAERQPAVFVSTYEVFQTKYGKFFADNGIKLVITPMFSEITTSKIVRKVLESYGKAAA